MPYLKILPSSDVQWGEVAEERGMHSIPAGSKTNNKAQADSCFVSVLGPPSATP